MLLPGGCAGLSKVRFVDAADRLDNATEGHHHSPGMANRTASATPMAAPKGRGHSRCPSQGHPWLFEGKGPAAVAPMKDPQKNSKCESPAITAARGSSVFFLTSTSIGRIQEVECTHANTLEHLICQLPLSFSTPSPAQDPGSILPYHQNGAFEFLIHEEIL